VLEVLRVCAEVRAAHLKHRRSKMNLELTAPRSPRGRPCVGTRACFAKLSRHHGLAEETDETPVRNLWGCQPARFTRIR
jgi:hypothetical protein